MTNISQSKAKLTRPDDVQVGSFFLETLTTGMYENPLHCIREYVQNGFDAVQDQIRNGALASDEGRILISIGGSQNSPSISIQDNGTGIDSEKAVGVLLSLGASRKNPSRHAGFRGIGRLAGIAYCKTLRFTTSAKGESIATVVEFDCGQIRGYFSPGADPVDVREVVSSSTRTSTRTATESEHYTLVEMIGLVNLGVEFADLDILEPYLREVCPVEYPDNFSFADQIRNFADGFGDNLPTIHIETKQKRERRPVLKPYRNNYPAAKKVSKLHSIEPVSSKENGWFGWLGVSNFPGEISDETVAGVRFRSKNIQIDGMSIIQRMAEELTPSGTDRRLMTYAVGEIFIVNPHIVPNARRDGFEDSDAWRSVRNEIKNRVAKRVRTLVRAASSTRSAIKKVNDQLENLSGRVSVESISLSEKTEVEELIRKQILELNSPSKFLGADPKEVSQLTASFKELAEILTDVPIDEESEYEEDNNGNANGDTSSGADSDVEGQGEPEKDNSGETEGTEDGTRDTDLVQDPKYEIVLSALLSELEQSQAERLAKRVVEAFQSKGNSSELKC